MQRSAWIELSSSAFTHNITQFRQSLPAQVKLAVVLKSNAYGHGLSPMGQLSQANDNIDYVCVFFLQEALLLRREGITKPILVLGFIDGLVEDAVIHDIDLVCFDQAQLKDFYAASQRLNKPINIHIKIDTGLSRLGFFPEQVPGIVQEIFDDYLGINIKGIMTHFSESGSLDVQWTERQERIFTETVELLKRKDRTFDLVHASNTAATMRFPNSRFNMVRIGGGSYGFPQRTVPSFDLKSVLTLKARIMAIKELPAGSFVSYDRLYQAPVARKIAIIPVGYSDGYGRRKPAGLHVLINGILAPSLGSVCMNMVIVDISHIPNVTLASEATLIGQHVGIRAIDIAPLIGCVNYEVTTALSPMLKRIIVDPI